MTPSAIVDIVGALFLLSGAFFCLAAAVGVVRFPDVLTRAHAATKPQVFGLVLVLTGTMLTLRTIEVVCLGLLTIVLQIATAPVSGHMLARTAYRTGRWDADGAVRDELGRDLAEAGFVLTPEQGILDPFVPDDLGDAEEPPPSRSR